MARRRPNDSCEVGCTCGAKEIDIVIQKMGEGMEAGRYR